MEYPGRLAMVPTDLVRLDEAYQRPLDSDRLEKMVSDFVPYLFQPLALSERDDGSLYAFDGQHRRALAERLGMAEVPAQIFRLTQSEEAAHFRDLQRRAKRLTAFDDWRAGKVALDPECIQLGELAAETGFEFVGAPSRRPRQIRAVHAVRRLLRHSGPDVVRTTLQALAIWDGLADQCHNEVVAGVGLFVARKNGDLDFTRLAERLAVVPPTLVYRAGKAAAARAGSSHNGFTPFVAQEVERIYRGRGQRTVVAIAA